MKSIWTKGKDSSQSKDIVASFEGGGLLRLRLTELLNEEIETSRRNGRAKDSYDNPSWAYLKADEVGYERALNKILEIIK